MHRRPARQAQLGTSLVEALIAFMVLSLGLLGLARLQSLIRQDADLARHRTEAVRLAQEDLETLRSSAAAPTANESATDPSHPGPAVMGSPAAPVGDFVSNTLYTLQRDVSAGPSARSPRVDVSWPERSGQTERVTLQSILTAVPPAFSGALLARSRPEAVAHVRGRSERIPLRSKDLGDGTSVFKPAEGGSVAWVFDNATGELRAHCAGIDPGTPTAALSPVDLAQCTAMAGWLLSGVVRFSLTAPPDAVHAADAPLPLSVTLALDPPSSQATPECSSEAMKWVALPSGSGQHRETVPLDATPQTLGVASWTDLGDQFVAYHCIVPRVPGGWSGRSVLVPQGWTLGAGAGQFKVCRYSADQDGSGAVDRNAEHPNTYDHVDESLMQQNFLVIRGDQACPGPSSSGAPAAGTTVLHQP